MKQVYLSCRLSALGKVLFVTFFSAVVRMSRASKVHFMTHLAESVGADPCSSVHSAISSGIDLKITGSPHPQIKNSQEYKDTAKLSSGVRPTFILLYLQDLLRSSFSDDDIVVFSDAESALYATSSSHIEDAFKMIERTDTILFAAERTCWPGDGGCPEIPSEVKSTYTFPHSGGWIARYSVAIKFLTEWVEVSLMLPEKSRHDQSALHQLMMQRGKRNESVAVNIDHNCIIFQTLESTIDKWAVVNDSNPYMRPDGVVYNPQTLSEPHILIFNKGRSFMAEAERILWLARTKSRSTLINCRAICISLFQKYPKLKACRADPTFLKLVKSHCHAALPRKNASVHNLSAFYPTIVQHFPVRLDPVDMKPVRRGSISMLKEGAKYTMEEYQRILQCSPVQPEIYGRGGALNLMSYIPLTQETIMLVAAYIESTCELWEGCREDVHNFLNGQYSSGTPGRLAYYSYTKLFRVINGSLYWDWPWGRERIIMYNPDYNFKQQFHHVLRFVSDVPDSVLFSGAEIGGLPANVPVPHFSSSPSGSASSDIPMPWNAPFQFESMRYFQNDYSTINTVPEDPMSHNGYVEVYNKTIDEAYRASFEKRLDKAAFFGSMTDTEHLSSHVIARQIIMNIAYDHPEHLIANWTICFTLTDINPASVSDDRSCHMDKVKWESLFNNTKTSKPFGFYDRTMETKSRKHMKLDEYMLTYKFLIVIGGIGSADRLNLFLAHSGAVILLQETDFRYHYSAFLKPWVHYVPLAFNCADVLEKIMWLKAHPKVAQRIAANGRNFGRSYLRLEDYYCYAATALEAVGAVATPSAMAPFSATLVPDILNPYQSYDLDKD